jgi:hypothetical protein
MAGRGSKFGADPLSTDRVPALEDLVSDEVDDLLLFWVDRCGQEHGLAAVWGCCQSLEAEASLRRPGRQAAAKI